MRKLASVQKILSLEPILNADRIVKATIMGWSVIVGKDEFKVGDKCLFLEIDSLCSPLIHPWAKPLEKNKYRVKTIKLKGVLSQGFAVPLYVLENININSLNIGDDLTSIIGIKKYENDLIKNNNKFKAGSIIKQFPTNLLPKTDEVRIQSNLSLLDRLKGKQFYITTKIDGTSATYLIDPNTKDFLVCSHNFVRKSSIRYNYKDIFIKILFFMSFGKYNKKYLQIKNLKVENVYWKVAKDNNLKNKLMKKYPYIAIQAEIVGPNIQGNKLCLNDYQMYVFNIIDLNNKKYVDLNTLIKICNEFNIKHVPIEEIGDSFNYNKDELIKKAKGYYFNTNNYKEGIVIRQKNSSLFMDLISFKVINDDLLLKEK